eukprot:767706-Hanusia_phi.AAC.4
MFMKALLCATWPPVTPSSLATEISDTRSAAAEAAVSGLDRLESSVELSAALGSSLQEGSRALRDAVSGPGCVGILRDCLHEVGVVDGVKDASGRWHCVASMHIPGALRLLCQPFLPPCISLPCLLCPALPLLCSSSSLGLTRTDHLSAVPAHMGAGDGGTSKQAVADEMEVSMSGDEEVGT